MAAQGSFHHQRQLIDWFVGDGDAHLRVLGLQLVGIRLHFHGLLRRANFELISSRTLAEASTVMLLVNSGRATGQGGAVHCQREESFFDGASPPIDSTMTLAAG